MRKEEGQNVVHLITSERLKTIMLSCSSTGLASLFATFTTVLYLYEHCWTNTMCTWIQYAHNTGLVVWCYSVFRCDVGG